MNYARHDFGTRRYGIPQNSTGEQAFAYPSSITHCCIRRLSLSFFLLWRETASRKVGKRLMTSTECMNGYSLFEVLGLIMTGGWF